MLKEKVSRHAVRNDRKHILAVGGALLLLLLGGCKGHGEEIVPPERYVLGEESAPALDQVMEEDGEFLVEEPPAEEGGALIYRYGLVTHTADLLGRYVKAMTEETEGFALTDENHHPLEESIKIEGEKGTLTLERATAQEGKLFQVTVSWDGENCTVQVAEADGEITPVEEVVEEDPLTLVAQLDYLYSLSPQVFGLTGNSMKEYRIYPTEGASMVDGKPCKEFNVYRAHSPETANEIQGCYLLSPDLQVYRLDAAAGTVTSLNGGNTGGKEAVSNELWN